MSSTNNPVPMEMTAPRIEVLWLGLLLIGTVAFFWDGFAFLARTWSQSEYSHGPLIPLVAGYICYRIWRSSPPSSETTSQIPGLIVMVLGFSVGFVGNVAQIPDVIGYGLIGVIIGTVFWLVGVRQGLRYWPGLVYLVFMLPLPNVLYWQVSTKLQLISSWIGVHIIQALGIPVFLDGNIIDLGTYKLQVAEACSGLRYLFPLMSFGYLFAILFRGPAWQKLILFLITIPLTVLMNSIRIGIIGILVDRYGIGQAEGFLHWFEGWIIFIACIAALYAMGILLRLTGGQNGSPLHVLNLDFRGDAQRASFPVFRSTGSLVSVGLAVLILGVGWQLLPPRAKPAIDRHMFSTFPMMIEGWTGISSVLDGNTERSLAADDYLLVDFVNADRSSPVNLFVSFYNSTTSGSGIHSPEICIPGGGWEVSSWHQMTIGSEAGVPAFKVNRAIIQKGVDRQLVYYWFEQRGRRLTSEYATKMYTLWDSALTGRTDGALVRLITPLHRGEPEAVADKRLATFFQAIHGVLPNFVPN